MTVEASLHVGTWRRCSTCPLTQQEPPARRDCAPDRTSVNRLTKARTVSATSLHVGHRVAPRYKSAIDPLDGIDSTMERIMRILLLPARVCILALAVVQL